MTEKTVTRRLAAIMAADVVGFSRMMGEDESGTLSVMRTIWEAIFNPTVEQHQGRIVKMMGDGALVEFASVVHAVDCAVTIQRSMAAKNAASDKPVEFRIGVNLGDIIIDGDDIFGDGVNVAARLEGRAPSGGVMTSDVVHNQIIGKTGVTFIDAGEVSLRNIERPLRVWRWAMHDTPDAVLHQGSRANTGSGVSAAPSIAVLPFDNMSDAADQDFLADGLAEDIITSLSKISDMTVISRVSSFAYKGRQLDIRQIASELGVKAVLEGSVRRGGNRIRVTAQLIDAVTGRHIWAERYDRELIDIFDLQDELTKEVVTALQVELTEGEQIRLRRRQTNDVRSWERYSRAVWHLRKFNLEDMQRAEDMLRDVVKSDPEFASAWSFLAWAYYADARLSWGKSVEKCIDLASDCAQKSISLDDSQSDPYAVLSCIELHKRNFDRALDYGHRSIELGPNVADSHVLHAMTLNYVNEAERALPLIEKAMRLSPSCPDWYLGIAGVTYKLLGRIDEAIAADKERLERNPQNTFSHFRLAAIYEEIGQHDMASHHVKEALRQNPELTIQKVKLSEPYKDAAVLTQHLEMLRCAGLPE